MTVSRLSKSLTFYGGGLLLSAFFGYAVSGRSVNAPVANAAQTFAQHSPATDSDNLRTSEVPPEDWPEASGYEAVLLDALDEPNALQRIHALNATVLALTPSEVPSAVVWARGLSGEDREQLLPLLAGKWAETNPQSAVAAAFTLEPDTRTEAMRAALAVWATDDEATLQAWGQQLPASALRECVVESLVAVWVKDDPAAALELLLSQSKNDVSSRALEIVFGNWVSRDPLAGAIGALSLPLGDLRRKAVEAAARSWASRDPSAALAWAIALPASKVRQSAVDEVCSMWIATDPETATQAVLAIPGQIRTHAIRAILERQDLTDAHLAVELTAALPKGWKLDASHRTAYLLSATDPIAALEYLKTAEYGPPMSGSENTYGNILSAWARRDLATALAWAEQQRDVSSRQEAFSYMISAWAEKEPQAAADHVIQKWRGADAKDYGDHLIWRILDQWAQVNVAQALAYAQKIADPKIRAAALVPVVEEIAESDPPAAGALALQLPAATLDNTNTVGRIARAWTNEDPLAAGAWATRLPKGEARTSAIRAVAAAWSSRDPDRAQAWGRSLPAGEDQDAALKPDPSAPEF